MRRMILISSIMGLYMGLVFAIWTHTDKIFKIDTSTGSAWVRTSIICIHYHDARFEVC